MVQPFLVDPVRNAQVPGVLNPVRPVVAASSYHSRVSFPASEKKAALSPEQQDGSYFYRAETSRLRECHHFAKRSARFSSRLRACFPLGKRRSGEKATVPAYLKDHNSI